MNLHHIELCKYPEDIRLHQSQQNNLTSHEVHLVPVVEFYAVSHGLHLNLS